MNSGPATTRSAGLGGDSIRMAISTICLGAVSYACLATGARLLPPDDLALFLSLWAVINTVVLTVVLPVEHLAPRLIAQGFGDRPIGMHAVGLSLLSGVGGLAVTLVINGADAAHVGGAVLVAGLAVWAAARAVVVGHGNFGRLAVISALNLGLVVVGLVSVWALGLGSARSLMVVAGVSALVSGAILAAGSRASDTADQRLRLPRAEYLLIGSMSSATFVTLLQSNGPMALARSWGVSAEDLVVYAGIVSLVRVPFMLLNNVMAPLNLRFTRLGSGGELADLRRAAAWSLTVMATAVAGIVLGVILLGGVGLRILIGADYTFDPTLAAGVVLAEGLIWMTVVPRLICGALGTGRVMVWSWGAGLIAFAGFSVARIEAVSLLILTPVASALTVLTVSVPAVMRHMSRAGHRQVTVG